MDVLVFGATSFVGQILCRYLGDRHGTTGSLKWAAAARSQAKLETLRDKLGPGAARLELLVADADDEPALRAMCARARVVISTVGPYALNGGTLIKVCVQTGTDYCDLTGEVLWIRQMIDRYQSAARASGARLVHCCGFDSIPSDLGVAFLQQEAVRRFGQPCTSVKMRVKAMRGGVSGGTVASLLNVIKLAAADPALRKQLGNPYLLCDPESIEPVLQSTVSAPSWDADFEAWCAPFVMAAVNTPVVHRSNTLQAHPYGMDFRYDEATLTGCSIRGRLTALGITTGLGAFMVGAAFPPTRWLLTRFALPAPGHGPSQQAQQSGFFDLHFLGTTTAGYRLRSRVVGDRDPGYGSTARMLGEAGACLAMDIPKSALGGGFWTPATALGDRLLKRLQAHAGLSFEVLESE
ncbi:MAG: saccharopine dehydrogenase NADP-binding domain-containing protein [Verrucomicrobiales bacterium]|nr:saccharopine dehydrogenase NADP-binding domain-containing protein [Verrucomicrobiales bacterium]